MSTADIRRHLRISHKGWRRTPLRTYLFGALALLMCAALIPALGFADGSRTLYPNDATCQDGGACRASIEWTTDTYGPSATSIRRRTLFSVYLKAGETLDLGSSAVGISRTANNVTTTGDAWVWSPGQITDDQTPNLPGINGAAGNPLFECSQQRASSGIATQGQIVSRAKETAGPQAVTGGGNPNGYVPCHLTANQTGVYKVAFFGPAGTNAARTGQPLGDITLTSPNNFNDQQGTNVSAWDITVRADDTTTTDTDGRLFTYALAGFTGKNGAPLETTVYATTLDGFRYQLDTNGLDPNGFLLYGNEQGFLDPEGSPLYHDVLGSDNALSALQGGTQFAAPQYPLSFTPLTDDTLSAINVKTAPTAPTLENLQFNGASSGKRVYVNKGGRFSFDTNEHGTYEIVISRDGTDFDPGTSTNRTLRGIVDGGSHTAVWDGKDNTGQQFPVGNYTVHASMHAGVYHFPLIDAENSTKGGPSFKLLNGPGGCAFGGSCTQAFYDDRGYHTSTADVGTIGATLCGQNPPSINHSDGVDGYDSLTNQRAYGASPGSNPGTSCNGSFGDTKGLDTWTFYPSAERNASFSILATPQAPTATDHSGTTNANTKLTVASTDTNSLLANDTGSNITVTSTTAPTKGGTVTFTPDGAWTYTPASGFSGTDTFRYTITDDAGQTATGNVSVLVTPTANTPKSATTTAGTPVSKDDNGSTNLKDGAQGTGLTVVAETKTTPNGSVVINADGTWTYTPNAGFSGNDSFTYTIKDQDGNPTTGTMNVTVNPTATNKTAQTTVNTAINPGTPNLLTGASGTATLTTSLKTQANNGTAAVNSDGTWTYTPKPNFSGTDVFTYAVTDPSGHQGTATVTITVTPTAADDNGSTPVNTPLNQTTSVLANDHGSLTIKTYDATTVNGGTVSMKPNGTYTYTPKTGYTGPDSFTYTATDGTTDVPATVNLTVTPLSPDDAYDAFANTTLNVTAADGVLNNDTPKGSLTVKSHTVLQVVGDPTAPAGTLTMTSPNGDGSFSYDPPTGFSGQVTFDYVSTDGTTDTTATVTITVKPVGQPDYNTTVAGTTLSVPSSSTDNLLHNDVGTGLTVTSVDTSSLNTKGTVTLAADGKGGYTYVPAAKFSGVDSFYYTAHDSTGSPYTQRVYITVTPKAVPDSVNAVSGQPLPIAPSDLTGNDLATGPTITSVDALTSAGGTVTQQNGSYTYTPPANFSGTDTFSYTITDAGQTGTSSALVTVTVKPYAADKTATTTAGTPVSKDDNGSTNLKDGSSGTNLSVTPESKPTTNGSVVINADGTWTYTPTPGTSGTDSFPYTITGAGNVSTTATMTVTVKPTAVDKTATTPVNTAVSQDDNGSTNLLDGASGTNLRASLGSQAGNGTAQVNADGTWTYTPNAGYTGKDTFTYKVTGANNVSTTATVTVTVTPTITSTRTATTTADTPVSKDDGGSSNLLDGSQGTGLQASLDTPPTNGTAVVNADGTWTYTPTTGFSGTDSFVYKVTGGNGVSTTGTMTITVKPTAAADTNTTVAGTPVTAASNSTKSLLANDVGTNLTVVSVDTTNTKGTVSLAGDNKGGYTYTPASKFSGTTSFGYTAKDAGGQTVSSTATITVTPKAIDDPYGTRTGATLTVSAADGVLANDLATNPAITAHTQPGHGTLTFNNADGSFSYVPDAGYSGPDSFTYDISADGGTSTATVTLAVGLVAVDDTATATAGTRLDVPAKGVLANDNGDQLSVVGHGTATHGTVTTNADGSYSYTPDAGYSGPDSFTYTVQDGSGATDQATVHLTVNPLAVDDTATTSVGTPLTVPARGVLANDLGSGLTAGSATAPQHGTVALAADGSYRYTPADGYSGPDSFTYTVTDATGGTSMAIVRITVTPTAAGDSVSTPVDTAVTIQPLGNDHGTGLKVTKVTDPAHGTASIVNGAIRFVPANGWSGVTTCTYTATDVSGQTVTAVETIHVTPVAVNDAARTPVDTPVALDVAQNDRGSSLHLTSVTQPPTDQGYVTIRDGLLVLHPARGFTGTVKVPYVVTDAAGQTTTATATILVAAVGDADPDTATTTPSRPVTIDPLANDPGHATFVLSTLQLRDPRTGELVDHVTIKGQGTYAVDGHTGKVVFTPAKGFTGKADPVTYQVADEHGVLHVSTIRVTVEAGTSATGNGSATGTGKGTASDGSLPGTGNEIRWPVPAAGLLMLLAGFVLLRRRRPTPVPVRVKGGSRRMLPGTHRKA